jgi:hypothetical protein
MNFKHLTVLSLAAVAAFASTACKSKDAGSGTTTSASAAASNSAGTKPAEKAAAPAEVPLDQFLTKVVPATCKTITECKNDKMKVTATMPILLITGFGTIDKPDLAKEVKGVDASMKADKRFLPNEKECTTLGNVALKVLDMQPDKLNSKVGKTISYDSKKAATCIAALGKAPNECSTEVKLATEPKMGEMDGFSKEMKPSLDAFAQPCEDVIAGLVDVGGACESDVECKGKGVKCKAPAGAKGGKAATGKVCQPKK